MPITTRGIDIDGIMAAALALSVGSQGTKYWTDIKTAIGTSPAVVLKRNGTTVYKDFISGALNTASGALVLPASLDEPATTNTAADIDSGTWVLEIQKSSDSNVAIIAPLGPPGTSDSLILSQDLNGSLTLKFSACSFPPPASLDVVTGSGAGTSYAAIAERAIDMMSTFNDDSLAEITSSTSAWWSRAIPQMQASGYSTHASVIFGAEPVVSNLPSWAYNHIRDNLNWALDDEWTDYLAWLVVFDGVANGGHLATNTGVKFSDFEVWARNQNTKVWTRRSKTALSNGNYGIKPTNAGSAGNLTWRENSPYRELYVPDKSQLINRSPHPYGGFTTLADYAQIDCVAIGIKASLIRWNPSVADDRASANLLLQIGVDAYPNSSHSLNGNWLPGCMLTKAKQITSTEQWFTAATLSTARKDYNSAAGCVISATEYRNNPPPMGS